MSPDPSLPLAGETILVTRPQAQAEPLCQLITRQGGRAISFPTLECVASKAVDGLRLDHADMGDIVIFASVNAVSWALATIVDDIQGLRGSQVLAMGSGTAEKLRTCGLGNVRHAGDYANSESLLALPELAADKIAGRRILLFKGEGGRDLLHNELSRRGADLVVRRVYRRILPSYTRCYVNNMWLSNRPDLVVTTSNEGLQNLVSLLPSGLHGRLFNCALVVFGKRAVVLARDLGFRARIEAALQMSNQGILQALCKISGTGYKL